MLFAAVFGGFTGRVAAAAGRVFGGVVAAVETGATGAFDGADVEGISGVCDGGDRHGRCVSLGSGSEGEGQGCRSVDFGRGGVMR